MSMMPDGGPITYEVILQKRQCSETYAKEVFAFKTDDMHSKIREIIRAQQALDRYKEQNKQNVR